MALPKKEHVTLADVLTWDEDERVELIDGVPVLMAPPSRKHQAVSGEIFRQIANFLEGRKCRAYAAPFGVRLFEREGDSPEDVDTVVEPDVTVVCDHDKLDEAGCKGAPDLIAEILSPSTQRRDRLEKYNLYQRAGVREYWIVDPETKTVQVCVLEGDHFKLTEVYTAGAIAKVNVLDGCFIELEKVFQE